MSLIPDGSNNITPSFTNIGDMYESPETGQINSTYHPIFECSNTSQLINVYYITMVFPLFLHGGKPLIRATSKGGMA
jgi:hypothetical protein